MKSLERQQSPVMNLQAIAPEEARELIDAGDAAFIDIREPDEFAREHILGAYSSPLSALGAAPFPCSAPWLIFCCKSGARTTANRDRLAAAVRRDAYILEGGVEAWKRAQLPMVTNRRQPIEIMRQVKIVAGSLVLSGVLLGATVSPTFYLLAAAVGAGLFVAGASGTCAMARFLRFMPWNRAVGLGERSLPGRQPPR